MQDSVANATGKGPVVFLEKDDKTYILAPIQMKELGAIEILAKKMHRADVKAYLEDMSDLLEPSERKEILIQLRSEVAGGAVPSTNGDPNHVPAWTWLNEIGSSIIIHEIIKYRLQKSHPELTDDEVDAMITVDAIAQVEAEMSELLGIDAFGGGDEVPGEAPSG